MAGSRWFAVLACVTLALPFAFATLPPLTDVPGHIGAAAVAAHAADHPDFARFFSFAWRPIPNLGADILVALLRHSIGIVPAYRLICAAAPVLLAAGIFALARSFRREGADAIGWALVFVYSYPLSYGFLNHVLGVSLALLAFAWWYRLRARALPSALLSVAAMPPLFLCHAVGACLFALLVGSASLAEWRGQGRDTRLLARRVAPLVALVVLIVLWRLGSASFAGRTVFSLKSKGNALLMVLRDQNIVLDLGSTIAAIVVFAVGWRAGARLHRAIVPALWVLIVAVVALPSSLSGSDFTDMRLVPLIPIVAFAAQDWTGVAPASRRLALWSGMIVLAVRLVVTAVGFHAYDARQDDEFAAVGHIAMDRRVLVLVGRDCSAMRHWRQARLNHFGDLAILYRRAWTNSQWDRDDGQLLTVRYRPSPRFYHDPSQYVWPATCGGPANNRPTLAQALAAAPLDRVDYLWLIDARLPAGYRDARLHGVWRSAHSALYRTDAAR